MPDLSRDASHTYWANYVDPMIHKVVTFMEAVERWVHDDQPEVEQALKNLGDELDEVDGIDLENASEFVEVCAYLHMARTLRLMQYLDTSKPGAASKLLIHAEETTNSSDDVAGLFLRRNIVFERLRLLSRVFAQPRLELVIKALEGEDHA